MSEQMSLKSPQLRERRDRVKEVPLGAQGPDSQPGPTLPGQRVSGGLRLGGGGGAASSMAMDSTGQSLEVSWPDPGGCWPPALFTLRLLSS